MPSPDSHLNTYRTLADQLDSRFRVPGTGIRFGWDFLLGLIPGLGDATGGLVGAYGLFVASRLGAPASVLLRMLFNLAVDISVGILPIAGDVYDLIWRSNRRNLKLLERWLERPHQTRRHSRLILFGVLAVLLILVLGTLWLTALLLGSIAGLFGR